MAPQRESLRDTPFALKSNEIMNRALAWIRRHPTKTIIGAATLGVAVVAVWNLFRPINDLRLNTIRKAGYPVTLTELDQFYPPVADSENAALVYTQAFASPLFGDDSLISDLFPDGLKAITRGQPLSVQSRKRLAELLSAHRPTIELLHHATNFARGRFPLDLTQGQMLLLPHLGKQKQAVMLLGAEAMLHAEEGDVARCVQALQAAQRAADALADEPLLISHLVRMACWGLFVQQLELILNRAAIPDADLAFLQQQLASAEHPGGLARALAGERAFGLAIFTDPKTQNAMLAQGKPPTLPSRIVGQAGFSFLKALGLLRKDRDFFLDRMEIQVSLAETSVPERLRQARQAPPLVVTNRFLLFSRLLLPSLARALERDAEHVARLRVARTALAMEGFRQAHQGALPERVEKLVPGWLEEVPKDLDDQTIRFRPLQAGFLIYSVGLDGRDDGGVEGDPRQSKAARDIVFKVQR